MANLLAKRSVRHASMAPTAVLESRRNQRQPQVITHLPHILPLQ